MWATWIPKWKSCKQTIGASLQDMTNSGLFFLPHGRSILTYDLVVTWVQFSKGTESMQPLSHFVWLWAYRLVAQRTDMHTFCFAVQCVLYISRICQLQSCTDRVTVLILNMNVRLPLFLCTWSLVLATDLSTCAGLEHWQWLSKLF